MPILNISYNDIPHKTITSSVDSEADGYRHENLFQGSGAIFWKTAAGRTQTDIILDLGSGNTDTIDHAIIHGANLLLAAKPSGTVGITISGSGDGVTYTSIYSDTDIIMADLVGSYGEILVLTGAESSAYRFFRIRIASSVSYVHILRKIYLGKFFSFPSADVKYPYAAKYSDSKGVIKSNGGAAFKSSSGRNAMDYQFTIRPISDANRDSYMRTIQRFEDDYPFFLYAAASASHKPLNDNVCVFGWIQSAFETHEVWKDVNSLSLNFSEDRA